MSKTQHNHEAIVNGVLAQLLTQRGLDAQAETTVGRRRPDIIITRKRDGARIYLETEYEPADTVDDDAKTRLDENMARSASFERLVAFAIKLPDTLKRENQKYLQQHLQDATLKWRVWSASREPSRPGKRLELKVGRAAIGGIDDLARAIGAVQAEFYDLEKAVDELQQGARQAGDKLGAATAGRLAKNVFKNDNYKPASDAEETAQLSALIVINAMAFQERLAPKNAKVQSLAELTDALSGEAELPNGSSDKSWQATFLKVWKLIIKKIDYFPIFDIACDIVRTLSSREVEFLKRCVASAQKVVEMTRDGNHDLSGQIFNRLVEDRKFVKAYYTRIPTATLLAGLALAPQRWGDLDWMDETTLNEFRVVDPACGTGTLLMAAYKQIEANAKIAELEDEQKRHAFHRAMVETAIHGFDVVAAAIHITAATLASIAHTTVFKKMKLAAPKYGVVHSKKGCDKHHKKCEKHLGSLDFIGSKVVEASFSAAQPTFADVKSFQPHSIEELTATIEQADLVIANPPYTRHESATGEGDSSSSIFGQFQSDDDYNTLSKQLSKKLRGTDANQIAGLASAFVVLADDYVKPNRRIAFVLPFNATSGTSWAKLRRRLAKLYEVEFVIGARADKSQSLSFDTRIPEVLLIARKLDDGEAPPRHAIFISLSSVPADAYEANLLVREINKIADPNTIRKISDAPVGGTVIGGQFVDKQWGEISKWGEAVLAPIGDKPWGSSMWQSGATGQYIWNLYNKGILWNDNGTRQVNKFELANLSDIANIGPHPRQTTGDNAPFEIYENYDIGNQYPAMWHLKSDEVKSMLQAPNAHLEPKQNSDYKAVWKNAGHLQIAPWLDYNAQSQGAVYTKRETLGVNSWFTLQLKSTKNADAYGIALALWLNSTLHLCCQLAHSSPSQVGRGMIRRTALLSLPVLNVTKLKGWQLSNAEKIWDDLKDAKFKSFSRCHEDKTRIELDERLLKDVFGLDADAFKAVARIRELLVYEPRVHGGNLPTQSLKKPTKRPRRTNR